MKRVLIIAPEFPPLPVIGRRRPLKFAKYLPLFGWKPLILTEKIDPYYCDSKLLEEIPEGLEVYRAPVIRMRFFLYLWNLYRRILRKSPVQDTLRGIILEIVGNRKESPLKNLIVNALKLSRSLIRYYLHIPDDHVGWLLPAVIKGLLIVRERHPSIIYATAPPYTSFLVGYALKIITGLPLVIDYRDLWREDVLRQWVKGWRKKIEHHIERRVISAADMIISVSKGYIKALQKQNPNIPETRFIHIPNGIDWDDFLGLKPKPREPGKFIIVYTGSLWKERRGEYFLQALGELLMENPSMRDKIRVKFIGTVEESHIQPMKQVIMKYNLTPVVQFIPYVTHKEALSYQLSADVLLLIVDKGPHNYGTLPGKIFEYLCARRPILGLVPDGEAKELILNCRAGVVTPATDVKRIKEAIMELFNYYYCERKKFNPNEAALKKFDRKTLTRVLADVFDELTRG